ncbi:MAG: hypothetical protein QOD96_4298, partial [Pseudonocardiales bacterium]|nr:hypothetical protein [Pseudonocardiales bacterium]
HEFDQNYVEFGEQRVGMPPVDGLDITPRPFLPAAELDAALSEADIVIAHAGTASALAVLEGGRMPLMTPRLSGHDNALVTNSRRFTRASSSSDAATVRRPLDRTRNPQLALATPGSNAPTATPIPAAGTSKL